MFESQTRRNENEKKSEAFKKDIQKRWQKN